MTKEEKIKQAWGVHWENIKEFADENGFIIMAISITRKVDLELHKEIRYHSKNTSGVMGMCVIPLCLKGIQNNNGWIKLKNKEDLPKNTGQYLTFRKNGIIITEWFYKNDCSWYLWKSCYNITHYKEIPKHIKPVY
jgi:glucan-binding YG repeat protein